MAADEKLWAQARRLYVESDETIDVFSARLGIAAQDVRRRARKEGWPPRSHRRGARKGGAVASMAASGHPTRAAREALIRRFYRAISGKLTEWEEAMSPADTTGKAKRKPPGAADNERRMKELGVLIANFEKVADVAAGAQKLDDGPGKKQPRGTLTSADTQRMREEIARRLEHLGAGRDAGRGSGAAAGGDDPEPDA